MGAQCVCINNADVGPAVPGLLAKQSHQLLTPTGINRVCLHQRDDILAQGHPLNKIYFVSPNKHMYYLILNKCFTRRLSMVHEMTTMGKLGSPIHQAEAIGTEPGVLQTFLKHTIGCNIKIYFKMEKLRHNLEKKSDGWVERWNNTQRGRQKDRQWGRPPRERCRHLPPFFSVPFRNASSVIRVEHDSGYHHHSHRHICSTHTTPNTRRILRFNAAPYNFLSVQRFAELIKTPAANGVMDPSIITQHRRRGWGVVR